MAVQHQICFQCHVPYPLISINERVIANEGKRQRSRLFYQCRVEFSSLKGHVRLS